MAFLTRNHLSRRTILHGMGVSLALPLLDSMIPAATALGQTAAGGARTPAHDPAGRPGPGRDPVRQRSASLCPRRPAIARDQARLLGGDIEAWSEPRRGTRFTLRLPVTEPLPDGDEGVAPGSEDEAAPTRGEVQP